MKKSKKKSQGLGGFRPGSGRKPISDEQLRTHGFNCTDTQWDKWKAAAKAAGKSLSKWIRETLDQATGE